MRTVVVVVLYRGCVFIRSHVCQSVRTNGERERARRGQSRSLCPRLLFRGHATTRSGTREREKERKRERKKRSRVHQIIARIFSNDYLVVVLVANDRSRRDFAREEETKSDGDVRERSRPRPLRPPRFGALLHGGRARDKREREIVSRSDPFQGKNDSIRV